MSVFIEDNSDKYKELKELITHLSENKEMNLDDLQVNIDNLHNMCDQIIAEKRKVTPVNLKDITVHLIYAIENERKKLYIELANETENLISMSEYYANGISIDSNLVKLFNLSKLQGKLKSFLIGKKLLYKDLKTIVAYNKFVESLFDAYFEELLKVEN
jgi:hypothetical protein